MKWFPNYFIFKGYLKKGDGERVRANRTLNPLWIRHWLEAELQFTLKAPRKNASEKVVC